MKVHFLLQFMRFWRLDFGTWEQIFYGEFDGRRTKRIMIKIIGE